MQGTVLRQCDRLLTLLHTLGLHAAVVAGLVMMPVVVGAGFVTARLDTPPASRRLSLPALRGSLDPLDHSRAAGRP